jgi:hypothetical protein
VDFPQYITASVSKAFRERFSIALESAFQGKTPRHQ